MVSPPAFPDDASLCERCGYPLRRLSPGGSCPECGQPVAASDPAHRTGPAWQRRRAFGPWLRTLVDPIRHPRSAFRRMTLVGSNVAPRVFILSVSVLVGLGWFVLDRLAVPIPAIQAWVEGMVAAKLCLVLTYGEAVGIWFFSRRRGWRVPLGLAERLACYAAGGWVLSLPLAWGLRAVSQWTLHHGAWLTLTNPLAGWSLFIAWAVAFAMVILPFELLVYFGVRQVRYANRPALLPGATPSARRGDPGRGPTPQDGPPSANPADAVHASPI